ncbi:MAG: hypothetical protein AAF798_10225 [Bacteroidota bacterium]
MPANPKYLSSGWTRFSKVTAAIIGTYFATMVLHVAVAKNVANDAPVVLTSTYSSFMMWVGLMIMVFLIRKAWAAWTILLSVIIIGGLLIYL